MLEWSEFARRLGRELAGLDRDTILIVREREESRHYVQAMREPDRLYAEAVSNNFLDGPLLLMPGDEEVMSEAGWRIPGDPTPRNWWTELPPFAGADDYARLAEMMVTALRDVQGVRRPAELVYESFHRHGTGLIELVDFGIDISDPGRVGERRSAPVLPAPSSGSPSRSSPAAPPPQPLPYPPQPAYAPNGNTAPGRDRSVDPGTEPGLEDRLTEAKQRGDHVTYFELLLASELILPATGEAVEDPNVTEFATVSIGTGTYVMAFTSPEALDRALGPSAGLYRRTTFDRIAAAWPDPTWSLAVNAGLPSEVHLDSATVARLDGMRRTARPDAAPAEPADVPAPPPDPVPPAPPSAPAQPAYPAPPARPAPADRAPAEQIAVRPPHGTPLYRDDGDSTVTIAVYDAVSGSWTAVVAPRGL